MPSLKSIRSQRVFATELEALVRTNQEIAVMKIQEVRQTMLSTRMYMEGLHDIFYDVRSSHQEHIEKLLEKHAQEKVAVENTKKSVLVLLSTNAHFSGPLIPAVFRQFSEEVAKGGSDILVIGKIGKELTEEHFPHLKFTYMDLDIENPKEEEIAPILQFLLPYGRIDIYEGRYFSLVEQKPIMLNISGNASLREAGRPPQDRVRRFLFEPSLDQILTFFEAQISRVLFRLALSESKLANLGSRITTLESSLANVEKQVLFLSRREASAIKRQNNRKQLQRIAGLALWS